MITAEGNFPQPPLGYSALRRSLRMGLSSAARLQWWPSLPRIPDGDGINEFTNVRELGSNRYRWANADVNLDPSSSVDVKAVYLVQLLVKQYQLFDEELVLTLTKVLVKELSDVSLVFSTLCDVMDRGSWFIPADAAQHRIRFETLRMLIEKNNKQFYQQLLQIDALTDKHLDIIFTKLFVDVLPADAVARFVSI